MHWYFRDISDDPSEKELTQQDQFNNDEVELAEALIRESIQNSTDAQSDTSKPVRVRFALHVPQTEDQRKILYGLVDGASPHFSACGFGRPSPSETIRTLVIEDFNTTGLKGSVEEKDNGQFSGFWRRFGRSNKSGAKGGRWGLGKLVFPSASQMRVVFGLTRREGEDRDWVMGQAVLKNHEINGTERDSVGFWCRSDSGRKGIPTNEREWCDTLRDATGMIRKSESGLSLAIPFLLPDIEPQHLITAAIRHYYFPILTDKLIVQVDQTTIDSQSFDEVAAALPAGAISDATLDFVRQLQKCRDQEPDAVLPDAWQPTRISADLLGEKTTEALREKFKSGQMILIHAPLSLTSKQGAKLRSFVKLFVRAIRPGEKPQSIVVRGAITVPAEGKRATFADCHTALIATDEPISRLLGDAENPAHTQWNERAEKLRNGWDRGGSVLRRVRGALHELHELIVEKLERNDPFAFLELFSIPRADRANPSAKDSAGRPTDLPPPKPKVFTINKRAGGFALLPGPGATNVRFPLDIKVRCAYDVLTGNPFKRFSDLDFNFLRANLEISTENAQCWPIQPNEVDVRAENAEFRVEISGFDPHRDVIIEAES